MLMIGHRVGCGVRPGAGHRPPAPAPPKCASPAALGGGSSWGARPARLGPTMFIVNQLSMNAAYLLANFG
jgi:hypothetical protein